MDYWDNRRQTLNLDPQETPRIDATWVLNAAGTALAAGSPLDLNGGAPVPPPA